MDAIYLDHAATTPIHPKVTKAMTDALSSDFGNPSSIHSFGRKARHAIDEARHTIARSIGAQSKEIIFTSGGTEADNMAIIGAAIANKEIGNHIITTEIEHHAVLHTCDYLATQGFDITYLKVDQFGRININDLQAALREETILVSIMFGNNEVGTLQDIPTIAKLCHDSHVLFHTDAVQAYGSVDIDVKEMAISMMTLSAHKINGPKGVGCLYVRDGIRLHSQLYGGEQERKRRAGTENVPGIVGFQAAVNLREASLFERYENYKKLRQVLINELQDQGVVFEINGHVENHLENIINLYFPGTRVESLLMNLDLSGVAVSSGSACTAGSIDPSHVLTAMFGEGNERANSSIRISFGLYNNEDQIKKAAKTIAETVKRLIA